MLLEPPSPWRTITLGTKLSVSPPSFFWSHCFWNAELNICCAFCFPFDYYDCLAS
jgi:hypothetical protein